MILTVTMNPSLDEWMELPSLRVGQLNRASTFTRYPGGKGINVSRVIHELGGHTVAYGFAGGEDGLILRELMNRMRIPHQFVDVNGTTRNNYKIRARQPAAVTEINTAGPRVSPGDVRQLRGRLFRCAPVPQCVVLSGSLPPGAAPRVYAQWIRALQRRNIPVGLDTSGSALAHGVRARPWFIKPNRDEMQELVGARLTSLTSLIRAARRVMFDGPRLLILSLGRDGALLVSSQPSGIWHAKPPAVNTRSAVGAGDSLVGGFVRGWANGQSVLEAFRLGIACGAATALSPGTELCHRRDVVRLLPRVAVTRVG